MEPAMRLLQLLEGRQGRNAWIPFDFPVPRAQTALMMVGQVFFFDVVITEHEVVQPPFPQQMIRLDDPQIVLGFELNCLADTHFVQAAPARSRRCVLWNG